MFPNFRLLIAALFGSIVALSCGFGVFADYRVNREPLARMPADTVALQLVADDGVQLAATTSWVAPFGSGVRDREAQDTGTLSNAPVFTPVRDASEQPNARTPAIVGSAEAVEPPPAHSAAPIARPVVAASPAIKSAPGSPALPTANSTAPASAAAPAQTAHVRGPQTPAPELKPAAAANASKPEPTANTAKATNTANTADTINPTNPTNPINTTGTAKLTKTAEPPNTTVAEIEPVTAPAPPVAPPAELTGARPQAAAPQAALKFVPMPRPRPTPGVLRRGVRRRWAAGRRRIIRRRPASTFARLAGNSDRREPVFISAPDFQTQQTPRRRTRRTAANSATATQTSRPDGQ